MTISLQADAGGTFGTLSVGGNEAFKFNADGLYECMPVTSYANDAAAAAAGVPIGGLYHTSGTVKIRLV